MRFLLGVWASDATEQQQPAIRRCQSHVTAFMPCHRHTLNFAPCSAATIIFRKKQYLSLAASDFSGYEEG